MPSLTNITVVSTRFLVIFAVVTVLVWVLAVRLHPRRGRRRIGWLLIGVASVLTITLTADGFNSYYSYLPNVSDVADAVVQQPPPPLSKVVLTAPNLAAVTPTVAPPVAPATTAAATHPGKPTKPVKAKGKMVTLSIPAGSGIGVTQAWVWLPPQYFESPQPRLPVMYLFHGSPGMPKDWFHGGRAANVGRLLAQQNTPVIEVAPQMSRNWLDDPECVDGAHEQVETHLLDQIIPTVDRSLRTQPDRDGRIFAGMSAGGYCALNLGLRHRDLVSTILDLSGYTIPTHTGGMSALFGADHAAAAAANSPAGYAAGLTGGPPMRVWLDSGSEDKQVIREMQAIAPILRSDNMTVLERTRPGGHSYSVWRPALQQAAVWAMSSPGLIH
jgi:enterochelin esterase-like enzyme